MRKKWSRVFDMKDFRGVGKVEEQDFVAWGRKAANNAGVEYTADLEQAWRSAHQAYFGKDVTKEAWIQHMADFVNSNPDTVVEISAEFNKKLMEVVDTNDDGVVSWKEFWCWIEPLGVMKEEGKSAFETCDINGDGTLDLKEFGTACARYYYDPDMSEFASFYGAYNAAVTPFMRKKWSRVFDMKDFRGVGKVEEQDFVAWGRKAANNAGVEYTADLEQAWRSAHQAYFGKDVTKEAWIQHMADFVNSNPDTVVEISAEFNKKLMEVVDTNDDGVVSWKEFWCWIEPLGVTEEEGKSAFETCDINGDGSLDLKEFGTACARYYYDPDMSEFASFYGSFHDGISFAEISKDADEDYDAPRVYWFCCARK